MKNEFVNMNEEGIVTEENLDISVLESGNSMAYVLAGAVVGVGAAVAIGKLASVAWRKFKKNKADKIDVSEEDIPVAEADVVN